MELVTDVTQDLRLHWPYMIGWHAFPIEDGISMLLNNIKSLLF
jgi:hypothetical protein